MSMGIDGPGLGPGLDGGFGCEFGGLGGGGGVGGGGDGGVGGFGPGLSHWLAETVVVAMSSRDRKMAAMILRFFILMVPMIVISSGAMSAFIAPYAGFVQS